MAIYGNTLFLEADTFSQNYNFSTIEQFLKMPVINPRYRVSILNPDETISYVIPSEDIAQEGISYTENYQQGQRKSISLTLINTIKKYTPSINGIWVNTKFRLDLGLEIMGQTVWFPKGIYVLGDISVEVSNSGRTVTYQLKDKFAIFEDKTGTLEVAYEIPVNSDVQQVINDIRNFDQGNGYILDYQQPIFDSSYLGFKTQATIRKEAGDNLGAVLLELATQMSAECYYNNVGNLCFYPINETIDDTQKPVIWTYDLWNNDIHNLSLTYDNTNIVNTVKVISSNVDYGVFSYVAINNNPASPICVERIGRRTAPPYSEANVWSNDTAEALAKYYLRKASFVSVKFTAPVSFNPILTVNNLCEVSNSFLNFQREKLLITSISLSSDTNEMQISFVNTQDLPFK